VLSNLGSISHFLQINDKLYSEPQELQVASNLMKVYQTRLYQDFHSLGTRKPTTDFCYQGSNHTTSRDYGVALVK
jgi:hypothetical protein